MAKRSKYVTRKQILSAIRFEPLEARSWVKIDPSTGSVLPQKDCPVCAVGGVLRRAGLSNAEATLFGRRMMSCGQVTASEEETLTQYLDEGRFLHALSIKFEQLADDIGTGKRTRKKLAAFVKEHFPLRVKLSASL